MDPLVSVSIKIHASQREKFQERNLSEAVRSWIDADIEISDASAPEKWAGVEKFIDIGDIRIWQMQDGSFVLPPTYQKQI